MRTAFETTGLEEDELEPHYAQQHSPPDREFTLRFSTILAIFFGLALLCGLFFAIGYTLGRRTPYEPITGQSTVSGEAVPSTLQLSSALKPSASVIQAPTATNSDSAPQPAEATSSDSIDNLATKPDSTEPLETTGGAEVHPALQLGSAPATTSKTASDKATPILVQIATIANPADANVLIGALSKRGYSAQARHDAADSLIHVQVGPFASRAEATAMRQKLLNDGYNAVLK